MKDSSDILIHEIIDDYQCPFTASEVMDFLLVWFCQISQILT